MLAKMAVGRNGNLDDLDDLDEMDDLDDLEGGWFGIVNS
jgi:hypothetical protein